MSTAIHRARGPTCGVTSQQLQQASAEALKSLCERRFEEVDLLVIYLDGKRFGGH